MNWYIETGELPKPISVTSTTCCSFQSKEKKTNFCENPKKIIMLGSEKGLSPWLRLSRLSDWLKYVKDENVTDSTVKNHRLENSDIQYTDLNWYLENGLISNVRKIQVFRNWKGWEDGQKGRMIDKTIFDFNKDNNILILDEEMFQYEIDDFGKLNKKLKLEFE